MNNPNNLTLEQRAITPKYNFGKGINYQMSPKRRAEKQAKRKSSLLERRTA